MSENSKCKCLKAILLPVEMFRTFNLGGGIFIYKKEHCQQRGYNRTVENTKRTVAVLQKIHQNYNGRSAAVSQKKRSEKYPRKAMVEVQRYRRKEKLTNTAEFTSSQRVTVYSGTTERKLQ